MPKMWHRAFPGLAWQVAEARHFVGALLGDENEALVNDAVIVVGELAANAVRHTRSGWYRGWFIVIVHFDDDLIRIEVVDQGGDEEPLQRKVTGPAEETGRGLMMVAACAKDWGVKGGSNGRRVWAELPRSGA
ncbi:ATP-binding protein [Streptomyces sp. 4F14]|uniref:ATP-binding protein n=1 Tax=Streptomyces sp. 4F14 TaxID=3394380 RepID=UPI003A85859A